MIVAASNVTQLKAAIAANPGGSITLDPIHWGILDLSGVTPALQTTLLCDGAHFEQIIMGGGTKNLTFMKGMAWPEKTQPNPNVAIVRADQTTSSIYIIGMDARSASDADDYMNWSLARWTARVARGIELQGPNSMIRGCRFLGLALPWSVSGTGSIIDGCLALGISMDGGHIIGNGSGVLAFNNFHADFVTTTGGAKHPDGIQGWSALPGKLAGTGLWKNCVVRGNTIVDRINIKDSCPFRISPQGIGFHNGSWANLTAEDNLILTEAGWGIHINLGSGSGATVKNNHCYDPYSHDRTHAQIWFKGAGIVQSGNVSGVQTYGAQVIRKPLNYAAIGAGAAIPNIPVWG